MQTTIFFIRHGEVHNPDNIIYGRLPNFGLSEKGKKQIEKTAEFLEDKQIRDLYSSPLHRAKESAEIIQKILNLPEVHISEEINEVQTSYQGKKFSDLDELQSEVYLKPLSPSDETIKQIADRMKRFISKLVQLHTGKSIALVSHGDPIMALKAVIENRPLDFMSFKTGSPYVKHGEVYQISEIGKNSFTITSVFRPIM